MNEKQVISYLGSLNARLFDHKLVRIDCDSIAKNFERKGFRHLVHTDINSKVSRNAYEVTCNDGTKVYFHAYYYRDGQEDKLFHIHFSDCLGLVFHTFKRAVEVTDQLTSSSLLNMYIRHNLLA